MRFAAIKIKKILGEEDGNITVFSVFMVVLVLLVTGASVDIMRFEAVRTKMQSTMDRAVLAATDLDQQQEPVGVVEDYMDKAGILDVLANVTVTENLTSRTVEASGSAQLDTIFLHLSGFDQLTAPAVSTAEERIANVEISLILDISGSMRTLSNSGTLSRMDRMRPAARNFIDKVMTEDTRGVTTLNLVPFAGHVNPGHILFDYYRGVRPPIPEPDVTEPTTDDATPQDPTTPWEDTGDYFEPWAQAISNIVFYFDTNGDDVYDVAHKIEGFPENAPRDADDFYKGAVAFLISQHADLTDPSQFLGASIKGGRVKTSYYQVKGDLNGTVNDIGPTKNRGGIPGDTYQYNNIDFAAWEPSYVSPNTEVLPDPADETVVESTNVNMPSSCIEIGNAEFATTDTPQGNDYVPHFVVWPIDWEVMEWGWCPGEDTTIQYYSSDKEALKDFVTNMRMYDGTGLHYAMKYGLALLDPNTRDEVTHLISAGVIDASFAGRPIDWNDPETEKFIVLMTDGQVTDQFRPWNSEAPINDRVALTEQSGSPYYTYTDVNSNRALLFQQCDLAKSLGVHVFTIAFETNETGAADAKRCASSPAHFFHVSGSDVAMAFDTVARQINNLRLIQ